MFPGFQVSRYKFDLILTEDLVLPPYKGFAFRGTMGHVLHELACTIHGEECRLCPFCQTCAYGYLFETVPDGTVRDARKFSSYPRPYVMNPPLEHKQNFHRYDRLSFEMVLIGRGHEFLSHIVATFDEIGRRGMRDETGRFLIDRVTAISAQGEETDAWRSGIFTGKHQNITWEDLETGALVDTIRLDFMTPLLIECKGVAISTAPVFNLLVESLHRRAALLHDFHGSGTFEYAQLPGGTSDVIIASDEMKWRSMARITNRQDKKLKIGGLVGSVTYKGNIGPYVQLLRLGELIGVGKSTVFGFGGYRLHFQ